MIFKISNIKKNRLSCIEFELRQVGEMDYKKMKLR